MMGDVFSNIVAEVVVASMIAVGPVIWLHFRKGPSIPIWFHLSVILTILVAYFAFFFIEYLFPREFVVSRRRTLHFALLTLVALVVSLPLFLMQFFTTARVNELLVRNTQLANDLRNARTAQNTADSRRLQIYGQVTDSLTKTLQKPSLEAADLYDLLHFCIESVALTKTDASGLRAAVFYAEKSGRYIVIPDNGYYGYALDQDIRRLYFDVAPQARGEDDERYLERLGVAGWCFVKKTSVNIPDIQQPVANRPYRYKPFQASQKAKADRSMICVGIPDLRNPGRSIGVLALSSPNAGVFTEADVAVAQFFAVLLARFEGPLDKR